MKVQKIQRLRSWIWSGTGQRVLYMGAYWEFRQIHCTREILQDVRLKKDRSAVSLVCESWNRCSVQEELYMVFIWTGTGERLGVRELKTDGLRNRNWKAVHLKEEPALKSTNSLRTANLLRTAPCRLSLCSKERKKWRMGKITWRWASLSVLEECHLCAKIKRMRRACQTQNENAYRFFVRKPERRNQLEELGVDGRTILKWILIV